MKLGFPSIADARAATEAYIAAHPNRPVLQWAPYSIDAAPRADPADPATYIGRITFLDGLYEVWPEQS